MKKKLALGLSLALALGLCACGAPAEAPPATGAPAYPDPEETVEAILSGMSTRQKLAQMMIVALRTGAGGGRAAAAITPAFREMLERYDFGGLLLFEENLIDEAQTLRLIRDSQAAATASPAGIPLLLCVDQEGGAVNRLRFGTAAPGNMALAAAGDPALTTECADMLGQELRALGFHLDFAPVADVNSNPRNPVIGVRSFSDDPEICARHVTAYLRGLRQNGIAAALKHFPGHGSVETDSHTGLPSSPQTAEELMAGELIPFRAGIEAGAEMVMTAHIQYPNMETGTYVSRQTGEEICLPATLSRRILGELLRGELGFEGIIVTDSLGMDAIAAHFDPTDAAVLAINAGADMLLCPVDLYRDGEIDTFPRMEEYMDRLLARVEAGEIPREELDDSVARILRLKLEKGLLTPPPEESPEEQLARAEAVVGSPAHRRREWEIAQQGLTLLKNRGGVLPLTEADRPGTRILIPGESCRPTVEYALGRLVREGRLESASAPTLCYRALRPEDESLRSALDGAETLVILSRSPERSELLSALIDRMHRQGGRVVLLCLDLPYDAACYEEADGVLCAYNPYGSARDEAGNGPFQLNTAAALCAVFGQTVPRGTLPVNLPRLAPGADGRLTYTEELLYPRGFGLRDWGQGIG